MKRLIAVAALAVAFTSYAQAQNSQNILYIFDASGSMWGQMDGRSKIEIARSVFADQIPSFAAGQVNAGLIAYGHRRKGDCRDIEQLIPMKPLNEAEFVNRIEAIQPKGKTPIAGALRLAVEKLRPLEDKSTIVLVSDGKETCDPDPCGAVKVLKASGVDFVLHVIGFDVKPDEQRQLQCLALAGEGRYFPANDSAGLIAAMTDVVPAEPVVLARENIQIIVDGSRQMAQPFDGQTRLEAASASVAKVLDLQVPDRDVLALRVFGGACEGRNTDLLIGFDHNNASEIRRKLAELEIAGVATLVDAVSAAAGDFKNTRRFPQQVNKKVVIVTGGPDACFPDAPQRLHGVLKRHAILPQFFYIGMNLPPDQEAAINQLVGASGGRMFNVTSTAKLEQVLTNLFEVSPVRDSISTLAKILNGVTKDLNRSSRAAKARKFEAAERHLSDAARKMEDSTLPFSDLGKRAQSRKVFARLYELARSNRDLQRDMLTLSGELIDHDKANNVPDYNRAVKSLNAATRQFNGNIRTIKSILAKL